MQERSQEELEFRRLYHEEMNMAIANPGVEIVCRQRYTLRERFLCLLDRPFTPTHGHPTVVYYPGMGFISFGR